MNKIADYYYTIMKYLTPMVSAEPMKIFFPFISGTSILKRKKAFWKVLDGLS
jgi:hypothetical protein